MSETFPQTFALLLFLIHYFFILPNFISTQFSRLQISQFIMLSTSRAAFRQVATKQFVAPTSVRAASAWAKVAQGPPVSNSYQ